MAATPVAGYAAESATPLDGVVRPDRNPFIRSPGWRLGVERPIHGVELLSHCQVTTRGAAHAARRHGSVAVPLEKKNRRTWGQGRPFPGSNLRPRRLMPADQGPDRLGCAGSAS